MAITSLIEWQEQDTIFANVERKSTSGLAGSFTMSKSPF